MEKIKMRDNNKKEQERTELYRTIWALANELRAAPHDLGHCKRSARERGWLGF